MVTTCICKHCFGLPGSVSGLQKAGFLQDLQDIDGLTFAGMPQNNYEENKSLTI
jgi:hypothetical protein